MICLDGSTQAPTFVWEGDGGQNISSVCPCGFALHVNKWLESAYDSRRIR